MRRNSGNSFRNSGTFTSPGTPEYGDGNQRGWYSERIPSHTNSSRRHISSAALMPFNSGRALPSKWDDAERWITSPVSGYGGSKVSLLQPPRRPKSKSGPLGTQGLMYLSNYSPSMPVVEGRGVKNLMAGSPFTAGVLVPDRVSVHYNADVGNKSQAAYDDMARSTSVPGMSDLLSESSLPSSRDDKISGTKDAENVVSHTVSRKDMATQMSPAGSSCSSRKGRSSFSAFPPSNPSELEPQNNQSAKVEVRDVEVDKSATLSRQPKKQRVRRKKKSMPDVKDIDTAWDVTAAGKSTSRLQREEAKITAWENLQKAKAEAAIRKLEMKLERKRSASMDKIMGKLRGAQLKAQQMRSAVSENNAPQASRNSSESAFYRKYVKKGSVSGCFFCQPF